MLSIVCSSSVQHFQASLHKPWYTSLHCVLLSVVALILTHPDVYVQVQVFSRVPVVVGTYINRVTCHPEDVSAKLWLACGAEGEVKYAAAQTTPAAQDVVPSVMAYEALVED